MAVYVDTMRAKLGRLIMCHMIADSDKELHAMAVAIGVDYRHWQSPTPRGSGSHYDICLAKKKLAIALGAIEISLTTLSIMNRRRRLTGVLGTPEEALDWYRNNPIRKPTQVLP